MSVAHNGISFMLTAVALFLPVMFGVFAVRASYCVYDPDYEGYHVWDSSEGTYYQRWEARVYVDAKHFISQA